MKSKIYALLSIAMVFVLLGVVAGFLGSLHPLFDSFSHFRMHLLVLLLLLALPLVFMGGKRGRSFAFLLFVSSSGYLLYMHQPFHQTTPTKESKTIKVMQFNLNFRNQQLHLLENYLAKEKIDIVTLQEVTRKHRKVLETKLASSYPYQSYCPFARVGGVAILSKYPFHSSKGSCRHNEGLVWKQVMVENQTINIASIHLYWSYPYRQYSQITKFAKTLQAIPSAKIIAGDFNAVGWSDTLSRFTTLSDTSIPKGIRYSLTKAMAIELPIDHMLLSNDLKVYNIKVGSDLGSDHLPIVSEVGYRK